MSNIYEALRRTEPEKVFVFPQSSDAPCVSPQPSSMLDWDQITPVRHAIRSDVRLPVLEDRSSLGAEKFSVLATRLRHLREDRPFKTLLVTSTGPNEGKSFVAANLALALAFMPRQKVLLVEGDLRKPTLMRSFGLIKFPGLVEHVEGKGQISHFLYRLQNPSLYLLPAGGNTDTPADSLHSARLDECLHELTGSFDWIIVDSPPVLPIADANLWAQRCDGILLVVRERKSSTRDLKKALEGLDNDNIVAVVLNECSRTTYKYSYRYHY